MPDISGSATAISGGDLSTDPNWDATNSLDGNKTYGATTSWASLQLSGSQANVSYIGAEWGAGNTARVDEVLLTQSNASNNRLFGANKIAVEYSDNGSDWTQLELISPTDTSAEETFTLATHTEAHRYWRLLAKGDVPGGGAAWGVAEVVWNGELNPAAGGAAGGGFLGVGRRGRALRRRR